MNGKLFLSFDASCYKYGEYMTTFKIGKLPEEDDNPIDRLIIYVGDKPVDSVIIGNPMTINCVIEKLELLAWRLKAHKSEYL